MFKATTFSTQAFRATSPTQVFRVTFINLGVQSRFAQFHLAQFRHSKPSLSIQVFKAILISFTFFRQAFKAISFLVRRSEPLFQLRHSEPFLLFRCSESPSLVQVFGAIIFIRCSKPFLSQAFKAIPPTSVQSRLHQFHRHSKPQAFKAIGLQSHSPYGRFKPPLSQLGVQSHFSSSSGQSYLAQFRRSKPLLSVQMFRVTSLAQAFRAISSVQSFKATFSNLSVQSHFLNLGVQGHSFSLGVQSHHHSHNRRSEPSFSLGAQSHSSHKHSELFFSQALRAIVQLFNIVHLSLGVQSHISGVRSRYFPRFFLFHCV